MISFDSKAIQFTDSKAIQQIEFAGQLKNTDVVNADGIRKMIILEKYNADNIEKNQRNTSKILSRKCNGLIKDGKLWRRVKLINNPL